MINAEEVLVVILGGGQGKRLYPLTKNRAKPAVSFGGKYRLIDIPIANCLRSHLNRIFILTQFNSFSLNRHIWQSYSGKIGSDGFIEVVAAEQTTTSGDWFQGTADAVRQTLQYILYHKPKYVLILSGDQVYSMEFSQMLLWHKERNAEVTIAAHFAAPGQLSGLGILKVAPGMRVTGFHEKPRSAAEVEGHKLGSGMQYPAGKPFLASMGIYLFDTPVLVDALNNSESDFGKTVIPMTAARNAMLAYAFDGYWEDVGTISAFYEANMEWRRGGGIATIFQDGTSIVTHSRQLPPTRIHGTMIHDSLIADGCNIRASELRRSIIGVRTRIDSGTVIEDSIVMGNDGFNEDGGFEIGPSCTIKKAICDKNVIIGEGCRIVNERNVRNADEKFYVIRDGIIVIPHGTIIPAGTVI